MAVCESCKREMLDGVSCTLTHLLLVNGSYERRRYHGAMPSVP